MLLSISPKHKTASLILPRDLMSPSPVIIQPYQYRLGFRRLALLQDTFEVNFGIRPERFMMVNFNGFVWIEPRHRR